MSARTTVSLAGLTLILTTGLLSAGTNAHGIPTPTGLQTPAPPVVVVLETEMGEIEVAVDVARAGHIGQLPQVRGRGDVRRRTVSSHGPAGHRESV